MAIEPLTHLPVQPWMRHEGAQRVMSALNRVQTGSARYVGGCVRNALLGYPVDDIDIATQLTPDVVTDALKEKGIAVHPTGLDHGTVTAVASGRTYEITSLRRDVETDGRRAVIEFTDSWEEDAGRRDFHLNALYADSWGRLFDPTGHGIEDLRARKIRFIGDADTRIREDYLRILRFFRFAAWYGSGTPNTEGLAACTRQRQGLESVSVERIWMELKKLFRAKDPRRSIKAMAKTGILSIVLPDSYGLNLLDQLVEIELRERYEPDAMVRLMSLFSKDIERVERMTQQMKMSNKEKKRWRAATLDRTDFSKQFDDVKFRKVLYRLGRQTFYDRARLAWAARGSDANNGYWRDLLQALSEWERPEFPICGDDVVAVGIKPGPVVGRILKELEIWWIEQDFPDDVTFIARHMRELADRELGRAGAQKNGAETSTEDA